MLNLECLNALMSTTALDARLEVGLEQQAELMLKMMATLEADAILQALTSSSPSGTQKKPTVKSFYLTDVDFDKT